VLSYYNTLKPYLCSVRLFSLVFLVTTIGHSPYWPISARFLCSTSAVIQILFPSVRSSLMYPSIVSWIIPSCPDTKRIFWWFSSSKSAFKGSNRTAAEFEAWCDSKSESVDELAVVAKCAYIALSIMFIRVHGTFATLSVFTCTYFELS
jgi:hypothetical protein